MISPDVIPTGARRQPRGAEGSPQEATGEDPSASRGMTAYNITVADFSAWRTEARRLAAAGVPPDRVQWRDAGDAQVDLFAATASPGLPATRAVTVPPAFLTLAIRAACHRDPDKWLLLYEALWRLNNGERHILALKTDPVIHRLHLMDKAIGRDAHKTKAFVRFRKTMEEDGTEHFIAWHRPDHKVLPLVAGFFARRFAVMRWTILTPDQSLSWDGADLSYGPGMPASAAPEPDTLEDMWKEYYRATFNPARIKLKMMRREMPVRHWATLPETQMIPSMLAEAESRAAQMVKYNEGFAQSAADFLPADLSIPSLRAAAPDCQGCPLHCIGSRVVFGEGHEHAGLMLIGEQPGDQEDRQGRPFVGPAGEVLDRALAQAGIDRAQLYVTNAVKHFKFEPRGKMRLHRNPGAREIQACKPWLEAEIAAVRPRAIVTLGATAGRSLFGHGFTLKDYRGQWRAQEGAQVMPTYHPSAVLRAQGMAQQEIYNALVEDLIAAKSAF